VATTSIEEIIEKTLDLPAVPLVAGRVLAVMNDPSPRLDELEEAISGDAAMTSRVLRIANSSYFGLGRTVETIGDALLVMGFRALGNVVLGASVRDVYARFGLTEKILWEHSLGVSVAAGLLAERYAGVGRGEASVAGLIHDIGKVIMSNTLADRYALIMERTYEERAPSVEVERDVLGFSHTEVGALIARKWNLPVSLANVIEFDHTPDRTPEENAEYRNLCSLIQTADAVCNRTGVGTQHEIEDALDGIAFPGDDRDTFIGNFKETYISEKVKFVEG